jgi:hypothetical protein
VDSQEPDSGPEKHAVVKDKSLENESVEAKKTTPVTESRVSTSRPTRFDSALDQFLPASLPDAARDLGGIPDISPASSGYGRHDPDIVISAPPEYNLPSYRLNLKPPRPKTGPTVLIRPPKGSLLPPITTRWPTLEKHHIPEFPQPRADPWRPAERPRTPGRRYRSYYWPPPNGDPRHPDSFLAMPVTKNLCGVPHSSHQGFWYLPMTNELPSIDAVLEHGRSRPVRQNPPQSMSQCLHLASLSEDMFPGFLRPWAHRFLQTAAVTRQNTAKPRESAREYLVDQVALTARPQTRRGVVRF